jgi:nucleoid DNA-binding protein
LVWGVELELSAGILIVLGSPALSVVFSNGCNWLTHCWRVVAMDPIKTGAAVLPSQEPPQARSGRIPRGTIPLQTCPACGSTWFREATFHQWPESSAARSLTMMPQTMLVCFCGTPAAPRLGGIRGGRTPNKEVNEFVRSLDRAKEILASRHREAVKQQAADLGARRQQVQALNPALARVERTLGRLQARTNPQRKSTRGRTWRLPQRQAPDPGRDYLALELQKRGFTFRKAREVVNAIWESIQKALQHGETVETPLGRFRVVKQPAPRTRIRLGKIQRLYRQRKKVVFKGELR